MKFMKCWINGLVGLALAAVLISASPARAEADFSPAQRNQIEQILRDYLLEHPELMIEVMDKLERRQQADAEQKRLQKLASNKAAIFSSPDDFVFNPKGTVPMVEFFDYQCTYCKRVLSSVMKVTAEQNDVRVAFKEYPILGPMSVLAAKAAIASKAQGKYMEFHAAVMAVKGRLNAAIVFAKAAEVGLDVARLKTDMASAEVQRIIDRNVELGRVMDIRGTPTLIIGDNLVPGAISYARMLKLIDQTRENCQIC